MPIKPAVLAIVKGFKYETLGDFATEGHFKQASLYYKTMIEQHDLLPLGPCVVHLALSGKSFADFQGVYEKEVAGRHKVAIRAFHMGESIDSPVGHIPQNANNFSLHFWFAKERGEFEREGFLLPAKPLAERMGSAQTGLGYLRNAQNIGEIENGIRVMIYSGIPFVDLAAQLGTRGEEESRNAFLGLVRTALHRVVLQAVPPTDRPTHADSRPAQNDC